MCQALEELMADELEEMRKSGWEEGEKLGLSSGLQEGIRSFAKLSKMLLRQNRQKELLRALEDEQYLEQLFQEYHILIPACKVDRIGSHGGSATGKKIK